MKPDYRQVTIAFSAVFFTILWGYFIYSGDDLLAQGKVPYLRENILVTIVSWSGVILQIWLWPAYSITQNLNISEPHSTITLCLITGAVSGIILATILLFLIHRFPKIYVVAISLLTALNLFTAYEWYMQNKAVDVIAKARLEIPHIST